MESLCRKRVERSFSARSSLWEKGQSPVAGEFDPNKDNYVNVDAIDLSLHGETSGDFTPVYVFDNPFLGKDTSKGVVFEFYAKPTWEVHVLGTIFAIQGTEDYDGRIYFTPGSYFGFNSEKFGGYFDANLYNYALVDDYIKDGATIRIELSETGFSVYSNDVLCYDQTILADSTRAAGDYTEQSDFAPVLKWLSGAQKLYFGYGSWWNTVSSCEANINLSDVSFRLADGTEVFSQLKADGELLKRLGGSLTLKNESKDIAASWELVTDAQPRLLNFDMVNYESESILKYMVVAVAVMFAIAVAILIYALKKRRYNDI